MISFSAMQNGSNAPKRRLQSQIDLTGCSMAAMLIPLSKKTKAGICTPDNQGHNRPLHTVVFLCPPKTQAALCPLFSVMAGCIGQPLKRLAGSLAGSANLIQSATPKLCTFEWRLFTLPRNHRMNTSQNKSAQNSEQTTLKTTNAEYTHALTEAQTRLAALTTSFALFIDEDYEPDILGYQCVIDDADRLAGTVRQLYHLAKNAKAAQQPGPSQSAQNQTNQVEEPRGFCPDYSHHDMCSDSQDVMGYFESLSRNGFMAGGIINLNRRAYLVEGNSETNRDDAYYSLLSARMLFEDSQSLTRAWIDAAKEAEQDQSRVGDSPGVSLYPKTIDVNTLASIDLITSQAINVLSSFTTVLAGVDPMTAAQYVEAFDSITSAINSINAVIDASGDKSETHQA